MDLRAAADILASVGRPPLDGAADAVLPEIEGYLIAEKIGSGAGGEVFRAFRVGSDRPLALKHLRCSLGGKEETRRAWRELDVLTEIHLAAVPRVLDYGIQDGRIYIVTDFIDGQSLEDYCQRNALDRRGRVALLIRVAEAVHSLHERGVIHRDVKPSNILIDGNGDPIIIDLGLALLLADDPVQTLTAEGVPIGSPAYMSPEQARGERSKISTRSDVYSLGATGYRLLTGATPHDMDTTIHEAVRRVAQDPPRDPRSIEPGLPRAVSAVLRKAVESDSARRYSSAAEFAEDLRRWLRGVPVEAASASLAARAIRTMLAHPVLVTLVIWVAMVVALVVSTWAAAWWVNRRPYRLSLSPDQRQVDLLSRRGRITKSWQAVTTDAYIPDILICTTESGAVRLAIVAVDTLEDPSAVWAFDVDGNLDAPYWRVSLTYEDLLPDPQGRDVHPYDFKPMVLKAEDIFTRPGREIIALYQHRARSQCLIRIYGTDGALLYHQWHDGNLHECYWMSGPRLLVLGGVNAEVPWDARGYALESSLIHPVVVFAVSPSIGFIGANWLDSEGPDDEGSPEWYLSLLPPSQASRFELRSLDPPPIPFDPKWFIEVAFWCADDHDAGLSWIINELGAEVHDTRIWGDRYQSVQGVAAPETLYLGPLPRVIDD